MSVVRAIRQMKEKWSAPRRSPESKPDIPTLTLVCEFSDHGVDVNSGATLPPHLIEFWQKCSTATLFKDIEYGQWGLRLLTPSEAKVETDAYFQSAQRKRSREIL